MQNIPVGISTYTKLISVSTVVPYGPLYYRKTIAIAQPYAGKFQ